MEADRERSAQWQAKVLEDSLKGNPDVGERALVSFSDGKLVQLEREGKTLAPRVRARQPLAREAAARRDPAVRRRDRRARRRGALGVLTQRRRDGLTKQIEGFVAGIGKRINDRARRVRTDRAELRWDENGIRYRIVLRKEDDEWRIDDIYIRPAPKDDETNKPGEIEGVAPEDF